MTCRPQTWRQNFSTSLAILKLMLQKNCLPRKISFALSWNYSLYHSHLKSWIFNRSLQRSLTSWILTLHLFYRRWSVSLRKNQRTCGVDKLQQLTGWNSWKLGYRCWITTRQVAWFFSCKASQSISELPLYIVHLFSVHVNIISPTLFQFPCKMPSFVHLFEGNTNIKSPTFWRTVKGQPVNPGSDDGGWGVLYRDGLDLRTSVCLPSGAMVCKRISFQKKKTWKNLSGIIRFQKWKNLSGICQEFVRNHQISEMYERTKIEWFEMRESWVVGFLQELLGLPDFSGSNFLAAACLVPPGAICSYWRRRE